MINTKKITLKELQKLIDKEELKEVKAIAKKSSDYKLDFDVDVGTDYIDLNINVWCNDDMIDSRQVLTLEDYNYYGLEEKLEVQFKKMGKRLV